MNNAPYELTSNKYLNKKDLSKIHLVEDIIDLYWNKNFMNNSIKLITKDLTSPFKFFYEFGLFYLNNNLLFHRYQLTDIFIALEKFLNNNEEYIYEIRYDYLKYHNIKPKIYWNNNLKKNDIIRKFYKLNSQFNLDKLYKYSVVTKYYDQYLIALYYPNNQEFYIFN